MRRGTAIKVGRLLIGIFASALLLGASIAVARSGSSKKVTISPQKVASAIATCPKGKGVIAGGFHSPAFSPGNNGAAAVRIGSKRLGPHKLKTTGFNFGDQPGTLSSIAYCSRLGRSVHLAAEKVFIPSQSPGVAIATCPGDERAISGGFATPGFSANGPRVVTLTSKRVGPGQWRVEAFNIPNDGSSSSPSPGTLIAYAYCVDSPPKVTIRKKRVEAGVMGTPKKVTVNCPQRMRAVAGGFDGNIYLSANSNGAGAIESRRTNHGRSWLLAAVSISGRSSKLTGIAYCVRRHR